MNRPTLALPTLKQRARRFARYRLSPSRVATGIEIAGIACIVAGIALVSIPFALIVGGALLVFLAQGVKS